MKQSYDKGIFRGGKRQFNTKRHKNSDYTTVVVGPRAVNI